MNPRADIPAQLRNFEAWRSLGFEAFTANTAAEAEPLRAAGLDPDCMRALTPQETAAVFGGKPAPRIRPLIYWVRRVRPGHPVILVNADIHPAARDGGFVDFWLSAAPAFALTREETPIVEAASAAARAPYRGGLDIFLFSGDALARVDDALGADPVSERMCFGTPGWDFMMGALLLTENIGGRIADSGFLLHETHPTTYANVEEFAHYLAALRDYVGIEAGSAAEGAALFAERIESECERAAHLTDRARSCWFEPAVARPSAEAEARAARFRSLAPWLRWNYGFGALAALADRNAAMAERDFAGCLTRSLNFFARSPSQRHRFAETLAAVLFELECRRGAEAPVVTEYPPGNLHAKAVEMIAENTARQPDLQRLEFARLFAEEWLDHGVANARVYDILVMLCENEEERRLAAEIGRHLRRQLSGSRHVA